MKIRHKLLLVLVVTSLATSVGIGLGSAGLLRRAVQERFTERIHAETGLLAVSLAPRVSAQDAEAAAISAARSLDLRVTLIGRAGEVLGDSAKHLEDLPAMENHLARPEIRQAAATGAGEATRVSASTGIEYFYAARRVEGDGAVRYVRTALPVASVRAIQSHYILLAILFALAALLVLAAIAYAVVRRLSAPIERMSRAAERTVAGDLGVEVPYDGTDEISQLGASINRMRARLLDKVGELDADHRLMASVLAGMKEGVLLVGPGRRIELANDAFRQIFRVPFDPAGRLLAEAIRNPAVHRDLDRAIADGLEVRDQVLDAADSGRSFEVHVTPLPSAAPGTPGRVLVLFFDITRLVALEEVRREFVADVSHELRTPLTSISAFVETLLEGNFGNAEESLQFLEIVRKNAERMRALIDDLTDLSLIETGAVEIRTAPIDASKIARDVAFELAHKYADRGVEVRADLPSPFLVHADPGRLEQVLVNLIDNGIKFNRPGGSVRVTGSLDDARPVIEVADTGVGIPADSLEKVFNRFYRVDRARSREMGGTGLGLAIVKHLMRLHGGSVRVESESGKGSRFILEFPPARDAVSAEEPAEGSGGAPPRA
jgi:two-component system phosphate regulon sensor histidine kinase PhoR